MLITHADSIVTKTGINCIEQENSIETQRLSKLTDSESQQIYNM